MVWKSVLYVLSEGREKGLWRGPSDRRRVLGSEVPVRASSTLLGNHQNKDMLSERTASWNVP